MSRRNKSGSRKSHPVHYGLAEELDAIVDSPITPLNLFLRALVAFFLITISYVLIVKLYFSIYPVLIVSGEQHMELFSGSVDLSMIKQKGTAEAPLVLLVFNGEVHSKEAVNIIKSMIANDPTSKEHLVICVSDKHSEKVAKDFQVPYFEMPELKTEGLYGSSKFAIFTRRKFEAIEVLLKAGHHVLYTDTDIVFKGPVYRTITNEALSKPNKLFFVQNDTRLVDGTPDTVCTGFMYLRPDPFVSQKFVELIKTMEEPARVKRGEDDQKVWNYLLNQDPRFKESLEYLDKCVYANGSRYFGSGKVKKPLCNKDIPVMVHGNWMKQPADKWKRFQAHGMIY